MEGAGGAPGERGSALRPAGPADASRLPAGLGLAPLPRLTRTRCRWHRPLPSPGRPRSPRFPSPWPAQHGRHPRHLGRRAPYTPPCLRPRPAPHAGRAPPMLSAPQRRPARSGHSPRDGAGRHRPRGAAPPLPSLARSAPTRGPHSPPAASSLPSQPRGEAAARAPPLPPLPAKPLRGSRPPPPRRGERVTWLQGAEQARRRPGDAAALLEDVAEDGTHAAARALPLQASPPAPQRARQPVLPHGSPGPPPPRCRPDPKARPRAAGQGAWPGGLALAGLSGSGSPG